MWTWNGRTGKKEMAMKSVRQMLGLLLCVLLVGSGSAVALEKVVYFHNDALGSPVAATNAQGQVLWTEAYDPYGTRVVKPASAKGNQLWYTGKQEETELGLNYFGARWYEPGIGRFHGMDPVGFRAGNVQTFNRYGYAYNNPYAYVDPDGRAGVAAGAEFAMGAAVLYFASQTFTPEQKQAMGESVVELGRKLIEFERGLLKPLLNESGSEGGGSETTSDEGSSNSDGRHRGADNKPRGDLPRDESGNYLPHPEAEGAHTTLGTRESGAGGSYTQGATFDGQGKFQGRTDVTDHGRHDHANPHYHPALGPNRVGPATDVQ